jgi:hypothetical protein
MKHVYRTIAVAALLLIMAHPGPAAGQEMTAAQEALFETQAQRHVERYYNFYYERDPQSLSTEIFSSPWMTIGANGIHIITQEENLAYFEAAIEGLIARDWNRSTFTTKNVCVLTSGSAIVSGTNTRSRTDGSIMSVGGVTYILGKTDEGWRITSYSGHSPNKIVRCPVE